MAIVIATVATLLSAGSPAANAAATIDHIVQKTSRWEEVYVNSPAMQRIVQLDVLLPADQSTPHPTLYLLDGDAATNTQAQSTWTIKTDVVNFFADKDVNVVMPVGGGGTFYTDWAKDDPTLGHNKWETFLTSELPPLIDSTLHGSGVNAVAGLSMGGFAAAILAFRFPSLYKALGVYSGCFYTSNLGQALVRTAVADRGGNADNMWGGALNAQWPAHDPSQHFQAYKGMAIYMYSGDGVPKPSDLTSFDPNYTYPTTLASAEAIEVTVNTCTLAMKTLMTAENIPATWRVGLTGIHSWPYWQYALHDSWPTLAPSLGLPA